MTDLYETLGVDKKASKAEIKKAFKKKSMKAHPDRKGGSEEEFTKVNEAYQVLVVAESRDHYDRTGKMKNKMSEASEIEQCFMGAFSHAASEIKAEDVDHVDLMTAMGDMIDKRISADEQELCKYGVEQDKFKKMIKKIKTKEKHNLMKMVLDQNLIAVKETIIGLEHKIKVHKGARELVNKYTFDFESVEEIGPQWARVSFDSASGGFSFT